MRTKTTVAIAGLAALAIGSSATAGEGKNDKVTGGGQVLIGSDERGAGSTLAYTAQGTVDEAKGRVTFIDRSGDEMTKFKGIVDCVEVTGNYGIVGGFRRGTGDDPEPERFDLRVVDNGEPGRNADMIVFEEDNPDVECGDEDADNEPPTALLARGNAQVRDGDASNPPAEESDSQALSLGLF